MACRGIEGHVREVALAVVWYAEPDLPGGFVVERAGAAAACKERSEPAYVRVAATFVPNIFWNIAESGRLIRTVCGRPVSAVRAVFVELSAANGNVERRGSKAVHRKSLAGGSWLIGVVTPGGAIVAA